MLKVCTNSNLRHAVRFRKPANPPPCLSKIKFPCLVASCPQDAQPEEPQKIHKPCKLISETSGAARAVSASLGLRVISVATRRSEKQLSFRTSEARNFPRSYGHESRTFGLGEAWTWAEFADCLNKMRSTFHPPGPPFQGPADEQSRPELA